MKDDKYKPAPWILLVLLIMMSALGACAKQSTSPLSFKIATSIYVGWMPWMYASQKGYLKEEARAAGLDVRLVRGDYADTIDQFIRGDVDALTVTNIDALPALAASGVAADVILVGSFSNGNDAILVNAGARDDLSGAKIALVENSVSQYLLDRYLHEKKIDRKAVSIVPVSDSEIARTLASAGNELTGVVTWQPIVGSIEGRLKTRRLADSAQFPREVADLLIIRRSVLQKHPEFAAALLRTWFRVMKDMTGPTRQDTVRQLATLSGDTPESYEAQLTTTILMSDPSQAVAPLEDPKMQENMQRVEQFARDHDLFGKVPTGTALFAKDASQEVVMRFNAEPVELLRR